MSGKIEERLVQLEHQQALQTKAIRQILEGKLEGAAGAAGTLVQLEGGQTSVDVQLGKALAGTEPPAPLPAPSPYVPPAIIESPSPNHGGKRHETIGCVIHSTRGGAITPEREFQGTLNWFANPTSQVSAHIVIAVDGTIAEVVEPDLTAWHAGVHNGSYLGVELVQPRQGDVITDQQYRSLAYWLKGMADMYGFTLTLTNLPEHKDTPQGRVAGKSDVGAPYTYERLKYFLEAG